MKELTQTEKSLLEQSAMKLIKDLGENKTALHLRENAFIHYNQEEKAYYQIQVTVTRDETSFLDDFQVEEMQSYLPNTPKA